MAVAVPRVSGRSPTRQRFRCAQDQRLDRNGIMGQGRRQRNACSLRTTVSRARSRSFRTRGGAPMAMPTDTPTQAVSPKLKKGAGTGLRPPQTSLPAPGTPAPAAPSAAAAMLELEVPRKDKRLLVIVETDGCFVDGVEAAVGVSVGGRTLRVEDYGKIAATFVDVKTERALRVAPRNRCPQPCPRLRPGANAALLRHAARLPAHAGRRAAHIRVGGAGETDRPRS